MVDRELLAVWGFLGVLLLGGIAQFLMFRRLRDRHPVVWRRMGGTSVPWALTMRSQFRVMRLVWSAEHRALEDPRLTTLVYLVRTLSLAVVVAWVLSIGWTE